MGRVSEGPKAERFEFIAGNHGHFGIRDLCQALKVSPQGYYQWRDRSEGVRDKEDRLVMEKITAIFHQHDGNYGSPRIYQALRLQGIQINHKRVGRLMKVAGPVGKAGRIYRRKPLVKNSCIAVSNLKREAGGPIKQNQQWAGDVAYLKFQGGWLYLAVVIDLYSRKVIGWELSKTRTVALTLAALNKAVDSRGIGEGLIFHSDRGSGYGAHQYQERLEQFGIRPSMDRPGCMNDNVFVETFFQTFKTESFKGIGFESVEELKTTLSWYLDEYYNSARLHGSLGYKSPCEYEKIAA